MCILLALNCKRRQAFTATLSFVERIQYVKEPADQVGQCRAQK